MVVQYIEAPSSEAPAGMGWPAVFLAGGITGCSDWQQDAVRLLRESDVDMVVLNPRRAHFDATDPLIHAQQVSWEFINLRTVGTVAFWFAPETVQPFALYELGGAMERSQQLVIGADPMYPRLLDVELQIRNAQRLGIVGPDVMIHSSLEDTMAATIGQVRHEWAILQP